jgi:hypothetical protein
VLDLHLRPDQLLELVPADLRDRTHRSLERPPEPPRTPLTALLRRLRGLVADRDPTAPRRVLTSHFSAGPTAGEPAYDSSADVVDHPGPGGSSRSCGESPLTGSRVRLAVHAGRAEGTGAWSGSDATSCGDGGLPDERGGTNQGRWPSWAQQ